MKGDKMTIIELINLRDKINHILKESEYGNYKNACSGLDDCRNKTNYKYEFLKEFKYFCKECLNLKRTEIPM